MITILAGAAPATAANTTLYCSTEDLSVGGLRFKSEFPLAKGAVLDLLLVMGWAYWSFEVKGKVMWVEATQGHPAYAIGLQFVSLSDPARVALSEALARAAPAAAGVAARPVANSST